MRRTKIQQLEDRAAYFEGRLQQGHRNKGVVTRWRRELLRTRAMIVCLQDGRRRGPWNEYLPDVKAPFDGVECTC